MVFGKSASFGSVFDLSTLNGSTGFRLVGGGGGYEAGTSAYAAGDFNGDGYDDIIIGVPGGGISETYNGAAYLIFGKASGFSALIDLASLALSDGIKLLGNADYDYAGYSVSGVGDVNGDGFDDIIIGAYGADTNPVDAGSAYVVFGYDTGGIVTDMGTSGADVLGGSGAADIMIAGAGNDTIIGNGGGDVVRAGQGDDIFRGFNNFNFRSIDMGAGDDTFTFQFSTVSLDFVANNIDLTGLERFDLQATNNTLTLDKLSVLRLSDTSNTVYVKGDGNDTVNLSFGFALNGTVVEGVTYDKYEDGEAIVLVQQGVTVSIPSATVLSLSTLNGSNGFLIGGVATDDGAGDEVAIIGDFDGDGFDNMLVSADFANYGGGDTGSAYIIFGAASGFATKISLATYIDGNAGFQVDGQNADDNLGEGASGAGDVNGDGLLDFVVGAWDYSQSASSYEGAVYVIYGTASSPGTHIDPGSMAVSVGFRIDGVNPSDVIGFNTSALGDIDGDGLDDFVFGVSSYGNVGTAYVIFGSTTFGASVDISSLDGVIGFQFDGVIAAQRVGTGVGGIGDINGDGYNDVGVAGK